MRRYGRGGTRKCYYACEPQSDSAWQEDRKLRYPSVSRRRALCTRRLRAYFQPAAGIDFASTYAIDSQPRYREVSILRASSPGGIATPTVSLGSRPDEFPRLSACPARSSSLMTCGVRCIGDHSPSPPCSATGTNRTTATSRLGSSPKSSINSALLAHKPPSASTSLSGISHSGSRYGLHVNRMSGPLVAPSTNGRLLQAW